MIPKFGGPVTVLAVEREGYFTIEDGNGCLYHESFISEKGKKKDAMTNNTGFSIHALSAEAFSQGVENVSLVDRVQRTPRNLVIQCSRCAYNDVGFQVGYTCWYIPFKLYKRLDLGIWEGFPLKLDPYVILPHAFEVRNIRHAARNSKTYYRPDMDFLQEESRFIIDEGIKNSPSAVFDEKDRSWSIGNHYYDLPTI